jgi:limonene-1,2-epoxide hydrolase
MTAKVNPTIETAPEWLPDLFAAIDAKNSDAFVGFLTPDARFRFGSAPAVNGRADIAGAVGGFFDSIAGLAHSVTACIVEGSTLFCEGEVTYTRHDGSTIALPFADVFELDGDMIADYKIYMDIAPLYAS